MKMKRQKIAIIMLGVLMIMSLSGCIKEEEERLPSNQVPIKKEEVKKNAEELKLGKIVPTAYAKVEGLKPEAGIYLSIIGRGERAPHWREIKAGAERAVSELNELLGYEGKDKITVGFNGSDRLEDISGQINLLDEELALYPKALAISMIDETSSMMQFDLAAESNIPIVTFESGSIYEGIAATCKTNNEEAAKKVATYISETLDEKAKVLILARTSKSAAVREREEGFIKEIEANYPRIEIVYQYYADDLQEIRDILYPMTPMEETEGFEDEEIEEEEQPEITEEEAVAYLLEQNEDIDIIFAADEESLNWILDKKEELEVQAEIVGFGRGEKLIQALESGEIKGLLAENPYAMGYAAVIACIRAITDRGNEAVIHTGFEWITKESLENEEIRLIVQ